MRYWLIALMIALLPVRSWVGDAMALGTASQQVALNQAPLTELAVAKGSLDVDMPEDCPMHSMAQAIDAVDAVDLGSESSAPCTGCDSCKLCLFIAAVADDSFEVSNFMTGSEPFGSGTSFSSADGALLLKPPIS